MDRQERAHRRLHRGGHKHRLGRPRLPRPRWGLDAARRRPASPWWRVPPGRVGPNASHLALVELQRLGKLRFLITQNTDGLHRRSGIRPEILAELHGNGQLMRCLGCDRLRDRQELGWDAARWGPGYRTQGPVPGQPACPDCGGRLLSSVVNFGDPLPQREYELDEHHARRCDLMLALGSSLTVRPASSLVGLALRSGTRVVLVNRGQTPYDGVATLRVWAGIGEVLPPAVGLARQTLAGQQGRAWATVCVPIYKDTRADFPCRPERR